MPRQPQWPPPYSSSRSPWLEFYFGEPVEKPGMQFSPAYLTGIEMDEHPAGMSMDPSAAHVEIDIHAAKGQEHGFAEDAWIPYLTVKLTIEQVGGKYKETRTLTPMVGADYPRMDFPISEQAQIRLTRRRLDSARDSIRGCDSSFGVVWRQRAASC